MSIAPRVLITGVGGRSVGYQILHALKQLEDQRKYDLILCDADETACGLYYSNRRYKVPFVSDPKYLPKILDIITSENVDIIIPGTEIELCFLAEHKQVIEEAGCQLLASNSGILETCFDKQKASVWLENNNIGTPKTATIKNWKALVEGCGFPIVAKPSDVTGGSRNVEILISEEEVAEYVERFPRDPSAILFQQYVGSAESEYTVGVLTDKHGQIIDSIVLKRVLIGLSLGIERVVDGKKYALSTGYSQGVVIKDEKIQSFCEGVAQKLGIVGPLNVQLRVHPDGSIKVFELHPRFSGTTSIRAQVGFNEVDLALRSYLNDEPLGRQDYQTNVYAMRSFQNTLIPVDDIKAVKERAQ